MMKKFREVAIVGVGLHPWGVFADRSMPEMAVEAIWEALADAKMEWREVESMAAGGYLWVSQREGMFGILSGTAISSAMGGIGIPITSCANACATGGAIFREAYLAVASGLYDTSIAVAADKSAGGFFRPQSQDTKFDLDYIRYVMTGETNPAYWAMECKRRMQDVGTTEDDLAMVKVLTSKPAPYNPKTRYKKVFTKEDVLNSAMVCDPLHLLEICATSDGAGAVIMCSLDKAKKYTNKPILVEAAVIGSPTFGDNTIPLTYLSAYPRRGVGILTESRNAIAAAYKMSGRKPEDIDIIELPDNSSWHYFAYLDCMLQAQDGEAEKMLRRGDVDPIDGKLPVCPSGGLCSCGEAVVAQGLFQIYELAKQLRGEAGQRQVKKKLKIGLAQTYGYAGNNAACVLSKAW
jgi:acetyl-CoA acetyltransferase